MNEYVISTDTFCDLGRSYFAAHQIQPLGAKYMIAGKEYDTTSPDCLDCQAFYALIRQGEMPKTSQVSIQHAQTLFEQFAREGKDVLHLSFSSALSGTYQACKLAAEETMSKYPTCRIVVVDTISASMGEGLLVDYCVRQKESGMAFDELYALIEAEKQRFCHYFVVDDLTHLHRGGRVSKLSAIVGGALGIKPVLHVDDAGKLIPFDKVRGRKQSLLALVTHFEKKIDQNADAPIYISHGDCLADAEFVAHTITERCGRTDIVIGEVGPVIGAHSGPGTVALFFISADRALK